MAADVKTLLPSLRGRALFDLYLGGKRLLGRPKTPLVSGGVSTLSAGFGGIGGRLTFCR